MNHFGENLAYLRRMHRHMTQEELADRLGVARQSISKWEHDGVCPDMEMLLAVCEVFSCSLDELVKEDLSRRFQCLTEPEIVTIPAFSYKAYTVISCDPETDAINRAKQMAQDLGIAEPKIIGWDFPHVSQEQINVYHMHGYTAALVLPQGRPAEDAVSQREQMYARITVCDPMQDPFVSIPGAYRVLMDFIAYNGYGHGVPQVLPCFEYEYDKDGQHRMDVLIAVS